MDLFEDLPEPSGKSGQSSSSLSLYDDIPTNKKSPVKPSTASSQPSLYDDISSTKGMSRQSSLTLFDDMPAPKEGSDGKTASNRDSVKRKLEESRKESRVKKQKTAAKYSINSYLSERQGEREDMQDAHLIVEDFTKEFTDLHPSIYRMSLYGVFDGHGGVKASR